MYSHTQSRTAIFMITCMKRYTVQCTYMYTCLSPCKTEGLQVSKSGSYGDNTVVSDHVTPGEGEGCEKGRGGGEGEEGVVVKETAGLEVQ